MPVLPIGPLMIEHRLIERMFKQIESEISIIESKGRVDLRFLDRVTDFVRVYADRCHHGKEEDILFRELEKRTISKEHRDIMEQLVEEHRWGRKTVAQLVEARGRYANGEEGVLDKILEDLRLLADFYPKHIEKEDRHFFMPVMDYFSKEEKDQLLEEGYAFDRGLIHNLYREKVEELEMGPGEPSEETGK